MIEIKNIKKSFGDKIVINDVSAVMQSGKCNLLYGNRPIEAILRMRSRETEKAPCFKYMVCRQF